MNWDLSYDSTEFAVSFRDKDEEAIFKIPIQPNVEVLLHEVLEGTERALTAEESLEKLPTYDPSSKHASTEPLKIDLGTSWLSKLQSVANLVTLESNANVLQDNPDKAVYYLARFTARNRTIIGLRRTSNFKGDLKKRLVTFMGNGLQEVESKIFRLDDVFDCVIDGSTVYILHPTSFEYLAEIEEQLRKHAAESVDQIDAKLAFVSMATVKQRVVESGSSRTARLIAAVAARTDLDKIDKQLFSDYCARQKIELKEEDGIFSPEKGHELELLKVLDRRLYDVELIPEETERYEASSRHRV